MADVVAARITIPVSTNAGKANIQMQALDKSLDKTDNSLKGINSQTKKATSSFKLLKSALPIAGLLATARGFKFLFDKASDAQETTNKFLVTFRGVTDEANNVAKENYK